MAPPRILVLTALANEAHAVARALPSVGPAVRTIGVGGAGTPAPDVLRTADWVVLAGLAGGLDPRLGVGDVVVDGAPEGFRTRLPWRTGRIHTAGAVVATPQDKARLFRETGAAVVDMEHARVHAALAGSSARLIGVRAVLDPAGTVLPAFLADLVDDHGRPRPLRIMLELIRRPAAAATLRWTGAASSKALARLAPVVGDLTAHLAASAVADAQNTDQPPSPADGAHGARSTRRPCPST